jgi:6,7-dimethyl-8-ribityllumazine synthase
MEQQLKIGIVIVDEYSTFAHNYLTATIESLRALGCSEQNILLRHSPRVYNATMVTQFFAEYTDVDAVVIPCPSADSPEYRAMLDGVTKLQIAWNMPVCVGDCTAAAEAAEMVRMQNEMEAAAPEQIAQDRKAIN